LGVIESRNRSLEIIESKNESLEIGVYKIFYLFYMGMRLLVGRRREI
jgi:hypothetical protein